MQYRELTSSQQIFFVDKGVFTSTLWNQAFLLTFDEEYTYEKINSALNEFALKQDGCRLQITVIDGKPYSYVTPYEKINFEYHVLKDNEELERFCREKLLINYELDQRLFRCYVVERQGKVGVLFCAHHILCDGMGVKAFEIIVDRLKNDKKMEEFSYLVQIEKEENYRKSPRFLRDKKFWQEVMDTRPPALIYNASPEVDNNRCKEFSFVIPKKIMDKARELCSEHYINLPAFFHTLLGVYFKRVKGKDSFYLGVPLMNRPSFYAMNTLGLFIHVIPILVDIKDDNFLNNCKLLLDTEMTAYRHQDFSSRDISALIDNQSIYDVVVDYHTTIAGYEYKALYSDTLSVGLEIHIEDTLDDKVDIFMRYRESIMNEFDLARMAEFINNFLNNALSNPDVSVLSLRAHEENLDAILVGDKVDYTPTTLYGEFAKTVQKYPDRICVKDGLTSISYLEFFKLTQGIAKLLVDSEVKPNDRVAIFGDKSCLWLASVYGIIATGAGYVPISPEYPDERLRVMLNDAKPTVILTEKKYYRRVKDIADISVICYDEVQFVAPSDFIDFSTPDTLAYVIYTSGTTGKPKGAMITNDSIINRLFWMQRKYPLDDSSAILFKTPYTFDVSVWEIFWWALFGAKTVICQGKDHVDVKKIVEYIQKDKITHIHFVPSMFRVFASNVNQDLNVEHLFLSGEKLYFKDVEEFNKKYPHIKIHNLYGPTECAVDVTYYDVERMLDCDLPIGKPIDNTRVFVLDDCDNYARLGEEGELCIAGKNVGLGYIGDEKLTNEKFKIKDGIRYYRTGDIAKITDGNVYFLGRKDGQQKINGQRLELDDIYANTKDIKGVEELAITVKDQRIYLFFSGEISVEQLKEKLKDKLPPYMRPHSVVKVDKIPLTVHGKIDMPKLLAIEGEQYEYVKPKTETERKICEIFAKRLKLEKFSANSSFIEEGASSIDVISVLCEEIFKGVNMDDVYTHPTPATLGAFIDDNSEVKTTALIPLSVNKLGKKAIVIFPHAGAGMISMHPLFIELKKILPEFSFYYTGWEADLDKVVEELNALSSNNEIYLYSHCAGICLQYRALERMDKKPKLCFSAGVIMPLTHRRAINVWRVIPNFLMNWILTTAGLTVPKDMDKVKEVFQPFRRDTKVYFAYFKKKDIKSVESKVALIHADGDFFGRDFEKAKKHASRYYKGGATMDVIRSDTHYFCAVHAKEVAEIIKRRIEEND